jgi:hypothetical protein
MNLPKRLCLSLAAFAAIYSGAASCSNGQLAATDSAHQSSGIASNQAISDGNDGQPMDVDRQLSIAEDDLIQRIGVDEDAIEVEAVRHVHWGSGAAGCPTPGMNYTMAIVPGVLILLRADGKVYRYHAGRNTTPSFCPADRAEAPVLGQGAEAM